jgi:hypothetical protein
VGSNPTVSARFIIQIGKAMENPATWTPLHHAISKAELYSSDAATAILSVLHDHNYHVTIDQVQAVINRHNEQMQMHICGLSLPSMIVNELTKVEG